MSLSNTKDPLSLHLNKENVDVNHHPRHFAAAS
jgi:hypothetical protein